ncbi:MAG: RagB/SusD family nutrient uptake outer membrane protein [Bacteroidales bacterium]|nr:RagB/SusD family nutrient uptake outer membrane protein [Bacteroidales bacterium]
MKKILLSLVACLMVFSGCDKINSLLDTTNYKKPDTSSFPQTEKDAEQLVNSAYYSMFTFYTGSIFRITLFRHMIASDDLYGHGSESSTETSAADRLLEISGDENNSTWGSYYKGIHRCNYALEAIEAMDDALFTGDNKNWYLGQAHFMRAFFLWIMADRHETFPLTLSFHVENTPNATVDEIYAAIADDLLKAIELIPAKYGYSRENNQAGRATKYAAEALLGRVWMFYTGFYKKDSMAGITKSQVISYLEECANTSVSKFDLEDDPREIWGYTNEYSSGLAYGADFDTYVSREGLRWVGNHSKETVWGVHFPFNTPSNTQAYNRLGEWLGMRNAAKTTNKDIYPYSAESNGNASVNPNMVKEWYEDPDYGPADKRFYGSFLATNQASIDKAYPWFKDGYVELPNFKGDNNKEVERTLFYPKKYVMTACYTDGTKTSMYKNFFHAINSAISNSKSGNKNDAIYIRFADVLLMLDELKGTVDGMNRLRARAGLEPYASYSFEKLQKERRYEFAFEGIRFDDLRRWYPDTAGEIIEKNQDGGYIEFKGNVVPGGYREMPGRSFSQRYAQTHGFWMVPMSQITLQEGMLKQHAGFEEGDNWIFTNGDLPYYDAIK